LHHLDDAAARTHTPVDNNTGLVPEAPLDTEDENRRAYFAELYRKSEDKIALLFADDGSYNYDAIESLRRYPVAGVELPPTTDHEPIKEPPLKKAQRAIDEDDYDDDDDDDDEDDDEAEAPAAKSQSAAAAAGSLLSPSKSGSSPVHSQSSPGKSADKAKTADASQGKDKQDADSITKLEQDRIATEEAARRSFHTIFYTLENDRTAMLEQQQLEDSEKQLQAEMDHNPTSNVVGAQAANHGTLSSANLGASSLTLKHLIARIDLKRNQVRASDAELRLLMNEVRKNRSKWASEENVNQEELYEAVEKVLTELKAHTEYSTPFLTRVNKRDAPDYYNCKFTALPRGVGIVLTR
jgi:transcriptional activator SPT7